MARADWVMQGWMTALSQRAATGCSTPGQQPMQDVRTGTGRMHQVRTHDDELLHWAAVTVGGSKKHVAGGDLEVPVD